MVKIEPTLTIEEFKTKLRELKEHNLASGSELKLNVEDYKRQLMMSMASEGISLKEFNDILSETWLSLTNSDIQSMYDTL